MSRIIIEKRGGAVTLRPLRDWFAGKPDGLYVVDVKRFRAKRSNPQNAWLWGCVYPLLMEGLLDAGWEFTDVEQVHEFFKRQLAMRTAVNRSTGEVFEFPASTAQMDTATFCAYCERLRDYGREYLGVDIPDPDPGWNEP